MLSRHHRVVYLVQGSRAYESNNMSIGLKAKPSVMDLKEKDKKYNHVVKAQLIIIIIIICYYLDETHSLVIDR